jgi:U3 small nucleolar RNA-associated protein 22
LDGYDFVLHLEPARVPRHRQAVQPETKALASRPNTAQAIRLGFDPVQAFAERAKAALGDTAVLFYDPNGGLVIAGLFNPSIASKVREFRIALDYGSEPFIGAQDANGKEGGSSKASVKLDREAILHKLSDMSEGLVSRVALRLS